MTSNERRPMVIGGWVAIGIGVGAALGVAMDNLPVWLAVGAAIGLAIGAGLSTRGRR